MEVSVVIATRNRFHHLQNTVQSIENQTLAPKEIIIVDASDDHEFVKQNISSKVLTRWIFSKPSVCIQRNTGIKAASAEWILLCDDDVELELDYIEKLISYINNEKEVGAVAGLCMQKENNEWAKNFPIEKFGALLCKFIFQHSIWGNIDAIKSPFLFRWIHGFINSFYKRKGNTQTLAGWPLITDWSGDVFKTKFYSLGAGAIIRKEWLLKSPYDENLSANGIGDNYGVALGLEGEQPIHVLTKALTYHHRANVNREEIGRVKFSRILALHYFLKKQNADFKTRIFFLWSLFGHCIYALLRERRYLNQIFNASWLVFTNNNPLNK